MLEEELFELLEQTADAAYTVTANGIYDPGTPPPSSFGYAPGEVTGRNVDEVFDGRDALGTDALAGGLEAATRRWDGASGGIPHFDLEVRAPTPSDWGRSISGSLSANP